MIPENKHEEAHEIELVQEEHPGKKVIFNAVNISFPSDLGLAEENVVIPFGDPHCALKITKLNLYLGHMLLSAFAGKKKENIKILSDETEEVTFIYFN